MVKGKFKNWQCSIVLVFWLVAVVVLTPTHASADPEDAACKSLDHCLHLLQTLDFSENYRGGMNKTASRLAKQFPQYGSQAVDRLVELLGHSDVQIRDRAGYALAHFGKIDAGHLDALIGAQLREVRWIPTSIARTKTPRAIKFLISELRKGPDFWANAQVHHALGLFPELSALPLLEELACGRACSIEFIDGAVLVFKEMKKIPYAVVPVIIRRLNSSTAKGNATFAAIKVSATLGDLAGPITPDLVRLWNEEGRFSEQAFQALIDLKHPAAIRGLLEELKHGTDDDKFGILLTISLFNERGYSAGPALEALLLDDLNWEYSWFVAFALGDIRYRPAGKTLIKALSSPDWLMAYHASESLGWLGEVDSREKLLELEGSHISAMVRSSARRVAAQLLKVEDKASVIHDRDSDTRLNFVSREDERSCKPGQLELGDVYPLVLGDEAATDRPKEDLKSSSLPRGAPTLKDLPAASAALRVKGGWLLAYDYGEYFRGLYFVDRNNRAELIIDGYTFDLHKAGGEILVATGRDSRIITESGKLGGEGFVWSVTRSRGRFSSKVLARLPDAPEQTILSPDGLWVILTSQGAIGLDETKPVRVDCVRPDGTE